VTTTTQQPNVLVVEDDEGARDLICRVVKRSGCQVASAKDGVEALQAMRTSSVDLLLTDMLMPRLSGHDLIQLVRAEHGDVPVIIISGAVDSEDIVDAFEMRVSQFIRKPFRPKDLHRALVAALDGQAPRQSLAARPANKPTTTPAPIAPPPAVTRRPLPVQPPPIDPSKSNARPSPALMTVLQSIAAELKSGNLAMPVADPVMSKLQALQQDEGLSASAVYQIVEQSPTLSSRAMSVANSAYYAGARQATNLKDAIYRLGNRRVLSLAQTILHQKFYQVECEVLEALLEASWMQTVFVATLAREFARGRVAHHPEDVYLSALLHNIGEVLLLRFTAQAWKATEMSEPDLAALTKFIHGQHQALGAQLLQGWRLPDAACELAGAHHAVPAKGAATDDQVKLIHLVNLASHSSAHHYARCAISALPNISPATSMEVLGITSESLQATVARCKAQCDSVTGDD